MAVFNLNVYFGICKNVFSSLKASALSNCGRRWRRFSNVFSKLYRKLSKRNGFPAKKTAEPMQIYNFTSHERSPKPTQSSNAGSWYAGMHVARDDLVVLPADTDSLHTGKYSVNNEIRLFEKPEHVWMENPESVWKLGNDSRTESQYNGVEGPNKKRVSAFFSFSSLFNYHSRASQEGREGVVDEDEDEDEDDQGRDDQEEHDNSDDTNMDPRLEKEFNYLAEIKEVQNTIFGLVGTFEPSLLKTVSSR